MLRYSSPLLGDTRMETEQEQKQEEQEQGFWQAFAKAVSIGVGAGLLGFAAGIGFHVASSMVSKDRK